jgi:hypothetical protein
MSYCPKCGNKIEEDMTFCPNCGAALKAQQPASGAWSQPTTYRRKEKTEEKSEKHEKREKGEKHEKGEYGFVGPLIGGLIVLFLGLAIYLRIQYSYDTNLLWALFFVLLGILIIVGGVYGVIMAGRRHPRA